MKFWSFWGRTLLMLACLALTAPAVMAATFAEKCAAPGVIKCVGFDSNAEIDSQGERYDNGQGVGPVLDTSRKATGNGSLKFTIPAGTGNADAGGQWNINFPGQPEGQVFWIQWKQYMDDVVANHRFSGSSGLKQITVYDGNGPSCAQVEFNVANSWHSGFPSGLIMCGSQDVKYAPPCDWNSSGGCPRYRANDWTTYTVKMALGGPIEAWITYQDGTTKKFLDDQSVSVWSYNSGGQFSRLKFNVYMTSLQSGNPKGETWYDDLIISRQAIDFGTTGGGSSGGGSGADTTPPAAPTNLSVTP